MLGICDGYITHSFDGKLLFKITEQYLFKTISDRFYLIEIQEVACDYVSKQ